VTYDSPMSRPQAGDVAPRFSMTADDGALVSSDGLAGERFVLYFYPKDDTPGCTIQGKSFTASKADYDDEGVRVVGVSQDDVASHKNFCNKFAFTIDLLSDTRAELQNALGIGQAEWKGMKFWERTSFVIDPKGVIRKVYEKVSPDGHEQVLLDDIRKLKTSASAA